MRQRPPTPAPRPLHPERSVICTAIRQQRLLEFDYHGLHRIVAPYCHGFSSRNREVLRAVQVGGQSSSGGFGFGKLWHVADIAAVTLTPQHFEPSDPSYNPDDSAMPVIHCRIER